MKILKLILSAALAFASAGVYAQNVTAVLLDASNGDPVSFATVSLTKAGQSKPAKYVLSSDDGKVVLEGVKNGLYLFKAEQLGYINYTEDIIVADGKSVDLGNIRMKIDAEQLDAASVSAVGNPIIVKKDTIEYNASSFKTTDNDVLEDLLKKLPGVEVGDDGAITVNGESITKIYIDGKTFFLDDPQLASKNIPAKIINKLKVIEKKSDQAEFTGIDDGEEETVIDLSIQPGMMRGLFGNLSAGAGHDIPSTDVSGDFRFQGTGFIGRFNDSDQISIILNANNTNNRGFNDISGGMMGGMMGGGGMMGMMGGGMMGGGRGGRGGGMGGGMGGNGITTSYMAGVNGGWDLLDGDMELSANYLYNHSNSDVEQQSVKETYLSDQTLIYKSSGLSNNTSGGHRVGVRLEHKFSDNTSIIFEPQLNFGTGSYVQSSKDSTYNDNLHGNQYKVNRSYTNNTGDNKNLTASGFFLLRQRLGLPGRTLTFMGRYSYSNNEMDGLNNNGTYTFQPDGSYLGNPELVNQSFNNKQNNYTLMGRLTYTEPLGNHFYVEANYSYNWNKSKSNKETWDLILNQRAVDYSNSIINETRRQEAGVNMLYQSESLRAQIGLSVQPTKTYNSTTKGTVSKEYNDTQLNFSPQAQVRWEINDNENMRINYRGRSSQPSTSQLMPVPDNTDPLSMTFGNPTLVPYFSHNFSGDYRFNNRMTFASCNFRFNGGFTQNPIVNATWYTPSGAQHSMPFNGPTSVNFGGNAFFNLPIAKSNFSVNNMIRLNWSKSSSYVGTNVPMYDGENFYEYMEDFLEKDYLGSYFTENTTKSLSFNDRLRLIYRSDYLEITVNGSTRMNRSWYTISTTADATTTWNNQVGASVNWTWDSTGIGLKSDFNYHWYNGYTTDQPSQYVLNAEITKLLFNNKVTAALRGYDILGQAKNLMVSDSGNAHTETINNTLGRYIIFAITYRFGSFNGNRRGGPMGGPGMGGPGGRPGMGGPMGGPGMGRR